MVKVLVDAGVNVSTADKDGRTPLSLAAERGYLDVVKVLVGAGANVSTADKDGRTPLSLAAKRGHWDVG